MPILILITVKGKMPPPIENLIFPIILPGLFKFREKCIYYKKLFRFSTENNHFDCLLKISFYISADFFYFLLKKSFSFFALIKIFVWFIVKNKLFEIFSTLLSLRNKFVTKFKRLPVCMLDILIIMAISIERNLIVNS